MNAWLAKPIPEVWFIRRPVFDPAQTLAAARGMASGQAHAAIGRDFLRLLPRPFRADFRCCGAQSQF
jgi:hypothetical protein